MCVVMWFMDDGFMDEKTCVVGVYVFGRIDADPVAFLAG